MADYLVQETGDKILLETGDGILLEQQLLPPPPPAPSIPADPQALTGYLCFIKQYILNKVKGWAPLKLPDGTLWD